MRNREGFCVKVIFKGMFERWVEVKMNKNILWLENKVNGV